MPQPPSHTDSSPAVPAALVATVTSMRGGGGGGEEEAATDATMRVARSALSISSATANATGERPEAA